MSQPISISALASVSPLGSNLDETWANYTNDAHFLSDENNTWVSRLPLHAVAKIEALKREDAKYKNLDNTVLYALYASRKAIEALPKHAITGLGINIGSSRGATALFEKYHKEFVLQGTAATLSSPTTTLGNISSWVAHDLGTKGPEISHSITCSTGLHAILNGMAWLKSGMANAFLVGGSEAPLTSFTIAQMKALKIYADGNHNYPCRAMDLQKKRNSMVLGEGASVCYLEKGITANTMAVIEGVGYATEPLEHNISISTDALCFQRSMHMALTYCDPQKIDVIITHSPGTMKGDSAELLAIKKVFGERSPALTNNKWKLGHTFGASGMLSLEMAILMLQHQKFIKVPYVKDTQEPARLQKIMVNAVGFGGNAVSIVVSVT